MTDSETEHQRVPLDVVQYTGTYHMLLSTTLVKTFIILGPARYYDRPTTHSSFVVNGDSPPASHEPVKTWSAL